MRIVRIIFCSIFLLAGMLTVSQPVPILAQRTPLEPGQERLNISCKYPAVEITPGESAEIIVEVNYLTYQGAGLGRRFDLLTTTPKNWAVFITDQYKKETKISAVTINPGEALSVAIRIVIAPPFWYMPEPGEYTVTLEVVGTTQEDKELKGSIDLKAVISEYHVLTLVPTMERYNTSATAGRDSYFSIELLNEGTSPIDDITLSSEKPEDWTIEFSPETVDALNAESSRQVEVNIKPQPRAIAGDYYITIRAEGKQTSARKIDIRVTVETPTIWGWVGVAIILLVVAGIVYIFMRFSRR